MTKVRIIMLLIIFLIVGAAPFANAGEESTTTELLPGQTVENLEVGDISWPEGLDEKIKLTNDGQGKFRVEIYNGPTRWLVAHQLAARDTTGQVDAHKLDLMFDAALNGVREQNMNRLFRIQGLLGGEIEYRHERNLSRPYIVIYFNECRVDTIVAASVFDGSIDDNCKRITHLEHDYSVMSGESKFALAVMVGATTTRHMIAPEISGTLFYRDVVMLRGNGFHGLFLDKERNIYGQPELTFDKGWGVGLGFKLNPIWLYAGAHAQCNTLRTSNLAGSNTGWFHGGELGLMLIDDKYSISLTGLYGYIRDYDQNLTDDFGVRFAINVGNTWR